MNKQAGGQARSEAPTQTQLIEKHRRGERISKAEAPHSIFEQVDTEQANAKCRHRGHWWRPIVCNGDIDICECGYCGEQRERGCDFDEDMS